jgi:hypothetical protein
MGLLRVLRAVVVMLPAKCRGRSARRYASCGRRAACSRCENGVATSWRIAHRQQLLEQRGGESDLAVVAPRSRGAGRSASSDGRNVPLACHGGAGDAAPRRRLGPRGRLTDDVAASSSTTTWSTPTARCRWPGCPRARTRASDAIGGRGPLGAPQPSGARIPCLAQLDRWREVAPCIPRCRDPNVARAAVASAPVR